MKHSRGVTMLEVLMSIVIISMVVALLFVLFLQIKREDDENQITSSFIINQTMFTKNIEDDIIDYGISQIDSCNFSDVNISNDSVVIEDVNKFKCVRIKFASDYIDDNVGYVLLYRYYTKYDLVNNNYKGKEPKWMFSYSRGKIVNNKFKPTHVSTQDLPDEIILHEPIKVKYTNDDGTVNTGEITIPIKSTFDIHYDVNLPFKFDNSSSNLCNTLASRLECSIY